MFLKCRPTGRTRKSTPRVKINGLAGRGDPTRMKPVSHGLIGRWRVGSGRLGSGDFYISRVGSGRVNSFLYLTGGVGSGQEAFKVSRV